MISSLLLCCDLDRTVLPNGLEPEDPQSMSAFKAIVDHPQITLAYITGRSKGLTENAIGKRGIPTPSVAATDVGSTIYTVGNQAKWTNWDCWHDYIKQDWNGHTTQDMANALSHISELTPQPEDRQTPYKLCYMTPPDLDGPALQETIRETLRSMGVCAEVVWSVDETVPVGLIDVVPARATKNGAVHHIMKALGFTLDNTLFAGDSGNDLPVLTGPVKSVLVANATDQVSEAAIQQAQENGNTDSLYLAKGGFRSMNGNYTAGILEGLHHFFPTYCS